MPSQSYILARAVFDSAEAQLSTLRFLTKVEFKAKQTTFITSRGTFCCASHVCPMVDL